VDVTDGVIDGDIVTDGVADGVTEGVGVFDGSISHVEFVTTVNPDISEDPDNTELTPE
jgi:hypothetical protein